MKNELMNLVDELFSIADIIQEEAFKVYIKNLDKISEDDYSVYMLNSDSVVANHKRQEYKKILQIDTGNVDKEMVKAILEVRKNQAKLSLYSIRSTGFNVIGTTLNYLRDLYTDVYLDFVRDSTQLKRNEEE